MEDIQHLEIVYQEMRNDEAIVSRKIKAGEDPKFAVAFLESTYAVEAVYWLYRQNDVNKSKASFFKAARIAEYMSGKFDRKVMDSGMNQISYAILSDEAGLIDRYSTLRNFKNHELNIGFQIPNAVQNVLLDRKSELEANIRNLERFVKIPKFKWWASLTDVFNGFLSGEEKKIEAGLRLMLDTHTKRNTDPLISKFLSIDTAGLCKLAWINGFQINLNSSFVPIELMPARPLSQYDDGAVLRGIL